MKKRVTKAIFPVAGMGTRFLPATKSVPKEIMTLVDRPLIQYAIDEARAAGIKDFIFVTSRGKSALEDYFDKAPELENALRKNAVILPDDVIAAEKPCLQQMVEAHEETGGCMVAAMEVPEEKASSYGVIDIKDDMGACVSVNGLVEKPPAEEAPSNLAVIGRYILTPTIMQNLNRIKTGSGGEIQLTDAIDAELREGRDVFGYRFRGQRFDCGSKAGFLQATVAFGLARDDLHTEFDSYLRELMSMRQAAQ